MLQTQLKTVRLIIVLKISEVNVQSSIIDQSVYTIQTIINASIVFYLIFNGKVSNDKSYTKKYIQYEYKFLGFSFSNISNISKRI